MHYAPDFVIPCGLSTLYRCLLTTMAKDKPHHKKPLIRDCCNRKGICNLFRPYLTIVAGISSWSFVRVSTRQLAVGSVSKGISSILNFHESINWYWRDSNSQPIAPKASGVSIELTWLLMKSRMKCYVTREQSASVSFTVHNKQNSKRRFLTCPCHKIYREEAVSLTHSNFTLKITIFVNMGNLGQFRENLIFFQ